MPALEARASGWEVITPSSYSGTSSADETAYVAQWGDYFLGDVSTINSGPAPGTAAVYPTPCPSTPSTRPFWKATARRSLYESASGIGGAAQIIANGKVRGKVHWQRRVVNGVPDATDNPPKYVYLLMNGDVKATATDGGGPGVRDPSIETVSVLVALDDPPASPAPGYQNLTPGYVWTAPTDTGSSTVSTATLNRAIKIDVAGRDEFWTPWIKIVGYANLPGNRSATTYPYGASYPSRTSWRNGGVSVMGGSDAGGVAYGASLLNLTLSPSPDQLALDDGSTRTDPLNQYTIDVGIPTSITVQSSDTTFTEYLRVNSSWNLTGTAPALRPLLPNMKVESNGTAIIRPQHPGLATSTAPNPTPTPENGLKLAVQTSAAPSTTSNVGWNFPTDNAQFGVKTLNHVISGTTIPAPVALFFPSTGFQHPSGGPKGYDYYITNSVDTPNWVYYYDQAWKNPGHFTVNYWVSQGEGSFSDPSNLEIYLGDDAHGLASSYRPTWLYAKTSSAPNAVSQLVGIEDVRGLDTYARVLTHEGCHLLMAIAIQRGASDSDNDRCPDVLEANAGLTVGIKNTNNWNPKIYAAYGDGESLATLYERSVASSSSDDWANDGFNYGKHSGDIVSLPIEQSGVKQTVLYTAPSRLRRVARQIIYTGPYENIQWPSISRDALNQLLPADRQTP